MFRYQWFDEWFSVSSISCSHTSFPVCPSVSVITKVFTSFAQSIHLFVRYLAFFHTSTSAFIYSSHFVLPIVRASPRLCRSFPYIYDFSSSGSGFASSFPYQYECSFQLSSGRICTHLGFARSFPYRYTASRRFNFCGCFFGNKFPAAEWLRRLIVELIP